MGIERIGQVGTLAHFAAPRAPVTWPHRSGAALPRQADCFQHRATAEALAAAVAGQQSVVLCQVLAGTGGMGKTQLAAHHARAAWQAGEVDLLVWVNAGSRDAIVSTYAQVGAEVTGADPDVPERAAERFLHWAETTDRRWLIVLDDVTDPADLRGLWPPHHPHGRTVLTTRRRDSALTGPGRHRIDVGVFTPDEATAYLTASLDAHDRREDATEIAGLAANLGHLPLALAQAVAYLIDSGLDCAAYRTRLADRARTLTDLLPESGGLPDDHRATVAATWSLSIEQANRLRPHGLARPLLNLSSMLDPNGIPHTVLTSPPALTYLTAHRTSGGTTGRVSTEDAIVAMRCLHRLSLADHIPSTPHRAVRVHALVQRVTRESLPADQQDALARTAADALVAAWPDIERDTGLARALRANAETLMRHAEGALYQPDAHELLFRLGESLDRSGQFTAAIAHFHRLARTIREDLSPDRPAVLTIRHNLAHLIGTAGDPAGATTAYTELLPDLVQVLGPDHPDTLVTRLAIAWWQGVAGDAAGAAAALADLLPDQVRLLGPNHPYTLIGRSTYCWWQGVAGDPGGAAAGYADLLPDLVRMLGPDARASLATRGSLAWWQGAAGDAASAAAALADLLPDLVRVQGPDGPVTLLTRLALARWQDEAGTAAITAHAVSEVLPDLVRVLGPNHPGTRTIRAILDRRRTEAGEGTNAVATLAELFPRLAPLISHPHFLTARHDLTSFRKQANTESDD